MEQTFLGQIFGILPFDAGYDTGASTGDVNLDGELNILDLVSSANMILEGE